MNQYYYLRTASYPTYIIDLAALLDPIDICTIMAKLEIQNYVYTFVHNGSIIKHGMSADAKSYNMGDRIYRQAGHLDGWKYRLSGPSGIEMEQISDAYRREVGKPLNRKFTKIIVRDLTNVVSPSVSDEFHHIKLLERELIKEHQIMYNRLPIGNINDESHMDRKVFTSNDIFNHLFVVD
jgi:hypothetical protein